MRARPPDKSKPAMEFRCKYLVGADGNTSVVRRALNIASGDAPKLAVFQSYFKIVSIGSLNPNGWMALFLPDNISSPQKQPVRGARGLVITVFRDCCRGVDS